MSLGEWLDEATPRRAEERVCFDGALLSRLTRAKAKYAAVGTAKMLGETDRLALKAQIEQLEAEVRDKTRTFVFSAIGWGPWRDLVSKHPPEADQVETFQRAVGYAFLPRALQEIDVHMETFVPAALAASCTEPGMTAAQAEAILQVEGGGTIDRLFAAVMSVNVAGGAEDPFVEGFIVSETQRVTAKR